MFSGRREDASLVVPSCRSTRHRRAGARVHRRAGGEVRSTPGSRDRRARAGAAWRCAASAWRGPGHRGGALVRPAPAAAGRHPQVHASARTGARDGSSPIVTVNLWFDRPVLDAPFVGFPGRPSSGRSTSARSPAGAPRTCRSCQAVQTTGCGRGGRRHSPSDRSTAGRVAAGARRQGRARLGGARARATSRWRRASPHGRGRAPRSRFVPRRRLDRHRPAGHHRERGGLGACAATAVLGGPDRRAPARPAACGVGPEEPAFAGAPARAAGGLIAAAIADLLQWLRRGGRSRPSIELPRRDPGASRLASNSAASSARACSSRRRASASTAAAA